MRRMLVGMACAGLLLTAAVGAEQKPAQVALQGAIRTEMVSGDLGKAIAEYQAIVDKYYKTDRAVVADALVRMADCYQKLGNAQATKLFERVVREFADQKQAAEIAGARLGRSKAAVSAGIVNRQVWTGSEVDPEGTITPDGRYLSFTDWSTGNLGLRDMAAGTNRHLTNKGGWAESDDFSEESTISRDGSQIAYSWFNSKTNRYEMRLVRTDAAAGTTPRVLYDNPDVIWVAPCDWSPDGRWLVVQVQRKDHTAQIAIVSTADGSYRQVKSVDWRGASRIFLSPDGSQLAYDLPAADSGGARDVFILSTDGTRESAVAPRPGDELVVGWAPDGRSLLFASDRAGSLGLWSMPVVNGQPAGSPTLIKADLGHLVSSVGVTRSGALLYGVRTSAVTVATAILDLASGRLIDGPPVPFETYLSILISPDWSPDGKLIVAVSEQSRARRGLTIRTADGKRVRELSPAMGYVMRPRWAPDGSITVQGSDLKGRQGFYRIDPESAEVRPILVAEGGTFVGQPSWLPDGRRIAFRRTEGDKTQAVIRDVVSGQETVLAENASLMGLSVSPDGTQIAYIVQNRGSRTTLVNTMPVTGGPVKELARMSPGHVVNATVWTPDSSAILFGQIDNDKRSLWSVSTRGGVAPRKLDAQVDAQSLRFHPDGRRIAYNTGENTMEIWTLENFLPRAVSVSTKR